MNWKIKKKKKVNYVIIYAKDFTMIHTMEIQKEELFGT